MEDLYEISLLLDFYGLLITQRQYEILDLHYNSDYSLGEIAEYLNISRQGVYDNIKRGKAALIDIEEKLKLVSRFSEQKRKAMEILKLLDSMDISSLDENEALKLKKVSEAVNEMIEE